MSFELLEKACRFTLLLAYKCVTMSFELLEKACRCKTSNDTTGMNSQERPAPKIRQLAHGEMGIVNQQL